MWLCRERCQGTHPGSSGLSSWVTADLRVRFLPFSSRPHPPSVTPLTRQRLLMAQRGSMPSHLKRVSQLDFSASCDTMVSLAGTTLSPYFFPASLAPALLCLRGPSASSCPYTGALLCRVKSSASCLPSLPRQPPPCLMASVTMPHLSSFFQTLSPFI